MLKLLLADDSPTTQKVVELTFADEGIEVVIADDGDRAMELFDHHHPDIVLADINIPGLNGYEVCEAIRKRGSNGTTPVILLAGSFEPFDVQEAHRVGANDYLTKPFSSIRRLVATVTGLLDTASRKDDAVDETLEPDSDAEGHVEADNPRQPMDHPEAGPPQPIEPDMLSTNDIEHLYSQSVVETVEMPHTIAERISAMPAVPEVQESVEPVPVDHADLSYDDELIETTFALSDEVPVEHAEKVTEETAESETENERGHLSAAEIPVPMDELPDPEWPVPQSEIPTVSFESLSHVPTPLTDNDQEVLQPAPVDGDRVEDRTVEDRQLDQSGDEAYFEPAADGQESFAPTGHDAETTPLPDENELVARASDERSQPEFSAMPDPVLADDSGSEAEPTSDVEATSPEVQTHPVNGEKRSEPASVASPWESVAVPAPPPPYSLDEANLLEIPGNNVGRPRFSESDKTAEGDIAAHVDRLTPEIVDQIAKVTASHISEELVREIAQRIVPKVIEEVISRQSGEDRDR